MSREDLINNVSSGRIALFLAVPAALAVVLAWVPFPASASIIVYAVAVFFLALWWPGAQSRKLDRAVVDFWYYTLALVGTALFFITNSGQREKLELAEAYAVAGSRLADAEKEQELFNRVTGHETEILAAVKAEAESRIAFNKETLARCPQIMMGRKFDMSREPEVDFEKAMCDAATFETEWQRITAVGSAQDLNKLVSEKKLDARYKVQVESEFVPIAAVASYLLFLPQTVEWQQKLAELRATVDALAAERTKAKERYEAIGTSIEDASARNAAVHIASFLWPYILIAALGLKLAREPYAYPKT